MDKVLITDPFIKENHHLNKPLYAALVPDEIFKGAHLERRFVTPFGGVWEKLAYVTALSHHGHCEKEKSIDGFVGSESLRRIQEVLNNLEHKRKDGKKIKPNWKKELEYVMEGGGDPVPTSVICDIYIESRVNSKKYAFELKAPLPNSDQTKVSKEKIFKLLCMKPKKVDASFFALPYNPYGEKKDYKWPFPMRWFNMHNDECVLIGDEFWNLIGGDGTYQNFISELNSVGLKYRKIIYREFLGIEPPKGFDKNILK